ncbi:phosphate signaling complex protein PhoU [Natronosporangium hydrolyticum]|uniref:Phosphate signaling complex protein PhoU n=1 Tax=Natronosporangium hydrolyticum TaxID=2811111 RepID=A0A895YHZ5_9ACTN|nr:phosphate signaling complex protein PhoU [Natronosporangium hydrolyticum]QSB15149.1 phosphate signaling complex protein PhoU [Natronosporangium hydrolyticum]
MAPVGIANPSRHFHGELEQLRLQVELMGLRVDENLARMGQVLRTGDVSLIAPALVADDEIDAMNVSLTERCYQLLTLESPVATDLRFIVSVLRITGELERVGDLSLRVTKLAEEVPLLRSAGSIWESLLNLVAGAVEQYRTALAAWSAQDLAGATALATRQHTLEHHYEQLVHDLRQYDGPEAARLAMGIMAAGRAADRIADHAAIIGARLRYLITGEPRHLAAEVR